MQLISEVLENYATTRRQLNGKAFNVGNVDQKNLLVELPKFFVTLLAKSGREKEFKVEGTIGIGNIARVPWVGIFNCAVTASAQEGYYIVLLFSEDMQSCYLSLNQGVTGLMGQYGPAIANLKMKTAANRALQFFVTAPDAILGPIDLNATGLLGKGYENSAIESFRYDRNNLPSHTTVIENFDRLLSDYDRLIWVAGPSLQFLAPISDHEFCQVAMEKAVIVDLDDDEPDRSLPVPPKSAASRSGYVRNVNFAALALKRANFKCEIDPNHETFLARARKHQYVEAHHLVPISKQEYFKVSLDVPANIVALCATCHKLLHHGRIIDKRDYLLRLLAARQGRLQEIEILLDSEQLLNFYRKNLLEEE